MRIAKLGVVGAGVMGSGIAALAASAGVPVVLLDVPGGDGDRGGIARQGLERARKARPAAFMVPGRAALVRTGNTEDDLGLLADCDLVLEAIIEQVTPKRDLYARLEPLLKPGALVASNTSGIPMGMLLEGRGDDFRRRFLGMHFFNPPRYLRLLEIIPTPSTDATTLDAARQFGERILGKGIVLAKDVPGFVANRLGVFGLVRVMRLMEEFDLGIDEVDALTGPLLGRPKSATFRTADITGLDVLGHVVRGLAQTTGEDLSMPEWVDRLVASGRLGEKSGAGFYKKVGKEIQTLDWRTLEYQPQRKADSAELAALGKMGFEPRLQAMRTLEGKYGDFLRKLLLEQSHYVLTTAPSLAYDIVNVDRALEWGFGWEAGPFQQMDALGHDFLRDGFQAMGRPIPPLLEQAGGAFYRSGSRPGEWLQLRFEGGYELVHDTPGAIRTRTLRARGAVLEENAEAALLDMGDGVALFETRSKMNTLGSTVLQLLRTSLERVARDGMAGLVVGNDDPRTFSAGANLGEVAVVAQAGDWKRLEQAVRAFQDTAMAIRQAPFPVVLAPHGLTLGGACEFSLHSDLVQAHAELYMGLVEVGVGLLPGGGGTKELLFRFTSELEPYEEADLFEGVKRAFRLITLAQTSTSALEARAMGLLRAHDRITMNRDHLLADAKARVLDLAPGYVAPAPRTIRALGGEAIGNLYYALFSFQEAGQASAHDVRIGRAVAYVLCGGDGPPRQATEQDVLDLEREAFLTLLGTRETQQRIEAMLKTGKPLRN
ncbi:MAG TPA: 3-hydroxyacyl-CoA dehydrogenase/enoyl-CoA hydratase family protein [Gemmatimonadaceae bacterium]|nr:3-hydroxyacyl-CoA dehydrogenase/enoyl-CoA hydratase family protein [Gemmatimonadaceae bacterium]